MKVNKQKSIFAFAVILIFVGIGFSVIPRVQADIDVPIYIEEKIPMRDGVKLFTKIYLPGDGEYPVILSRTPYNVGDLVTDINKVQWPDAVSHGYAVVMQDTRGRFHSEGIDRLFYNDGPDGYDTIDWIANQDWCNGKIGMTGGSALGITTYLAAGENHPNLVAAISYVASADLYNDLTYEGGAFRFDSRIWTYGQTLLGLSNSHTFSVVPPSEWANIPTYFASVYAEYVDLVSHAYPTAPNRAVDSEAWMGLPLIGENPNFSILQPFADEILRHPSKDEFRDELNVLDTIKIPILHLAGWFDFFSMCTFHAFTQLQYLGNQKLFVLPGTHGGLGAMPYDPTYRWFDYWLKGEDTGIMDEPSITYYRLGEDDWLWADEWPPTGVQYQRFYMHDDGSLNPCRPNYKEDSISYLYDPMNPVLTWGGRNLGLPAGSFDQRPVVLGRDDILSYTTAPLREDTEITGSLKVYLSASSDCLDTDFTAKLIDVYPTGELMLIADGIIRARYRNSMAIPELMSGNPEDVYEFTINMGDICQVFKEGHSIRVDISSSNFPKHDRNLNTGGELYTETSMQIAENTIHHDKKHSSYIVLPIRTKEPRVFEGCVNIRLPGLKYKGPAEFHIYENAMYLHFEDQWVKWDIKCAFKFFRVAMYRGDSNIGRLNVVVVESRWAYHLTASGRKVIFLAMVFK
jgi:putative CocE/NonD family hydrolase